MKELEEAKQKTLEMFEDEDVGGGKSWIEWVHEGTSPARTQSEKLKNTLAALLPIHCPTCLNLNGCLFSKTNMPQLPLHPNCHCKTIPVFAPVAGVSAIAECELIKFTEYIFSEKYILNGKKALFESWGYDIMDSEWLQSEYIRQAQEKYASGEYELGKLDKFGQMINIETILTKSNGEIIGFKSGWAVYPNGIIILVAPFGGWL